MRTPEEVQKYINNTFGTYDFENNGCRLWEAEEFLIWLNHFPIEKEINHEGL